LKSNIEYIKIETSSIVAHKFNLSISEEALMSKKTTQRVLFALVLVVLLIASFFAGRMLNNHTLVHAQDIPGDENRATSYNCDIEQVAIFNNRAHIKCTNYILVGSDAVYYFAVANTPENQMFLNRVMAIGLTNMSMNRSAYIFYDSNTAHNPAGCNTSDCRNLVAITGYK
jgi:hypothetical protein